MKRFFVVVLLYVFLVLPAFAQYINTDELNFNEMTFSPTENPVTYQYFVDYADMLRRKINFVKLNPSWGIYFDYMINVDGSVSNLTNSMLPNSKRTNNYYLGRFLMDNPPPPYPDDMEIGYVDVHLYIQNDTKDETFIYFKNNESEKSLYKGNQVFIAIYKKSFITKIFDKLLF